MRRYLLVRIDTPIASRDWKEIFFLLEADLGRAGTRMKVIAPIGRERIVQNQKSQCQVAPWMNKALKITPRANHI
jgi:hypothetical protein